MSRRSRNLELRLVCVEEARAVAQAVGFGSAYASIEERWCRITHGNIVVLTAREAHALMRGISRLDGDGEFREAVEESLVAYKNAGPQAEVEGLLVSL